MTTPPRTRRREQLARRMGARAGRRFRDTGLPTRNPFPAGDLADAWADAYLGAARAGNGTH